MPSANVAVNFSCFDLKAALQVQVRTWQQLLVLQNVGLSETLRRQLISFQKLDQRPIWTGCVVTCQIYKVIIFHTRVAKIQYRPPPND